MFYSERHLLLFIMLLAAVFLGANTGSTSRVVPSNMATTVGRNVRLECSTPVNRSVVVWYFNSLKHVVFTGYGVTKSFQGRVNVSPTGRHSDVVIRSVQLSDAGRYICVASDTGKSASAELIVFDDQHLVCTTNISSSNHVIRDSDFFQLSCSFDYSGNWEPSIEWQRLDAGGRQRTVLGDGIVSHLNVTSRDISKHVVSHLVVQATADGSGDRYSARIYFVLSHKADSTTATNIPNYDDTWTSEPIRVLHGPHSLRITVTGSMFIDKPTISCSADGNPTPNYEWVDLNTGELIQNGSELSVCDVSTRQPQQLQCVAKNSVLGDAWDAKGLVLLNATFWKNAIRHCDDSFELDSNMAPTFAIAAVCGSIVLLVVLALLVGYVRWHKTVTSSRSRDEDQLGTYRPPAMYNEIDSQPPTPVDDLPMPYAVDMRLPSLPMRNVATSLPAIPVSEAVVNERRQRPTSFDNPHSMRVESVSSLLPAAAAASGRDAHLPPVHEASSAGGDVLTLSSTGDRKDPYQGLKRETRCAPDQPTDYSRLSQLKLD